MKNHISRTITREEEKSLLNVEVSERCEDKSLVNLMVMMKFIDCGLNSVELTVPRHHLSEQSNNAKALWMK